MNIYYQDTILIEDVVITQAAEHEEELMKSDFVKLSWDEDVFRKLPADAYITPFDDGIKYSLLEPYEPESKNGYWHYEPHFQHPKMYLGKVTFHCPETDEKGQYINRDTDGNVISLMDWPFTGGLTVLLDYFIIEINKAFGFTKEEDLFRYFILGEVESSVTATFSSQDILSALSNVANILECEWHIDWKKRILYFGKQIIDNSMLNTPTLVVGQNVNLASNKDSKEGYWNGFEVQGGTRNITRLAESGENVQATLRLALDRTKYPNGVIYSLGEFRDNADDHAPVSLEVTGVGASVNLGKIYPTLLTSKVWDNDDFNAVNKRSDDYNIFATIVVTIDGVEKNAEAEPSSDNFLRIIILEEYNSISEAVEAYKSLKGGTVDVTTGMKANKVDKLVTYNNEQFAELNRKAFIKSLIFDNIFPKQDLYVYDVRYRERYLLSDKDDPTTKIASHQDAYGNIIYKRYAIWYVRLAYIEEKDSAGNVLKWGDFLLYPYVPAEVRYTAWQKVGDNRWRPAFDVKLQWNDAYYKTVYTNPEDESHYANITIEHNGTRKPAVAQQVGEDTRIVFGNTYNTYEAALEEARAFVSAGDVVHIIEGMHFDILPEGMAISPIIDGTEPVIAFQPNTYRKQTDVVDGIPVYQYPESSSLAGRGNGDGNGHYGFKIFPFDEQSEVDDENNDIESAVAQDPDDTGVIYADGTKSQVKLGDYRIIFEDSDDYVLPSTQSQGIIPRGVKANGKEVQDLNALSDKNDGKLGNLVNMYNIAMPKSFEDAAKKELEQEAKKYITNTFTDYNSYTVKSNPVDFEEVYRNDADNSEGSRLFIGRKVYYVNGEDYTAEKPLATRVMKIITKLDHEYEQEIVVGNKVIKGSQEQMREQVQTIIAGGAGGSSGGMDATTVQRIVQEWVSQRYLSKIFSDKAKEVITFVKGVVSKAKSVFEQGFFLGTQEEYGIDGNGKATLQSIQAAENAQVLQILKSLGIENNLTVGNDITVDGILTALTRIISDRIQSSNYNGDGAFDTGFKLEKGLDGITHLVVDNLFVRMKAIFNELEIRKISYSGGNIIFSHAGSRIVAVRAIYASGLIFDEDTLADYDGVFDGDMLDTRGSIHNNDTLEDFGDEGDVLYYRCYLLKDDGTTATENWWRVDDQARCETFNVVQSGNYQNKTNQFYWRRVVDAGTERLADGKDYDYVDLSVLDCIAGSTAPQAGDQIVQMGNRTDMTRQGFITIDVYGENAPGFKVYKNVNDYTLDGKRKICISPSLSELKVQKLVIETEYDIMPVPNQRSEDWYEGMQCYFNDVVQHNGGSWRCIYPEHGINNVLYTTEEPSDTAIYWKIYAKKGTGVKSVSVSYAVQTAEKYNGVPPTAGWKESIAALGDIAEGSFVWTKSVTKYSDTLSDSTTYSVSRFGVDGDGIHELETKFYESSTAKTQAQLNTLSESEWKEYSQLALTQGDYIYTRIKITYDKNTTPAVSYSVNRIGQDGISYLTTEEYYCLGDSDSTPPTGHPYTRTDGKPQEIAAKSLVISGAWSESRPTYDTSTAQGRAKKYLWNFEVSYDTTANVKVTQPLCVGNFSKGIASIVETYAISASAVSGAGDYPSDITAWTDEAHDCAPTDAKPYQWNKTVTTYTDGSSDTFYHVSAVKGTKGTSITKKSEEVKYKVADNGTTIPTGTWYDTKANAIAVKAWDEDKYMWTRTIITWSDDTTTTLYSAERNPNDGKAGMSIQIKSQSVKYSKQSSGGLDPTTLTYGNYPSSLSKGDWLYTETTVTYQNSNGADAGETKTYGVSYIGTDGVAGKGISSITEYYAASTSKDQAPADNAFGTSIPSDWDANKPYLWNYEKTEYTKGNPTSTTKSVIAIFTENGKGLDSITNYYLATSASSGVTRSTSGWTTTVQAIDADKQYLWNYEKMTWIEKDGTTTDTFTTPHIIGHFGKDGKSITKKSETAYYIKNTTGTRPAENDANWSTTKPTLSKGEWLFTKTVITWSDDSTTILYTDERNPNDGISGQDIIVDGATDIKYAVSNTNTTQPTTWSNYADIVSQIQGGKWLWSKATTYYRKANSAANTHDAGQSVNYSVSYIGTDGKSVVYDAEHSSIKYAVSAYGTADAGRDYPSDITSWSTSMPDIQKGKYLWTQDITAYDNGGTLETTTTYGVSYWGTDGDSVQIDASRTFVKYSSVKTASKPADSTFTLSDPPALSQGDYLWVLSQTAYVGNNNPLKSYSVSRVGSDGNNGDPGADGYTTHFAYATSADGSQNFSTTNFNGATYIGTYRDKNNADSTNYRDYTWTQWKGNNGANGRALTSSSEHYNVSNSSTTEWSVPASGAYSGEWTTNPNVPNSSNVSQWNANNKYLWNYEKVVYTESNGTQTIARTTPHVVAIWTKDGKGIDSITNYYAINNDPNNAPTSGWDDDPIAPTAENPYLWNYEVISWTDGSADTSTEKHVIGHFGKDGTSITKKSEVAYYAKNTTGTRPAANDSSWSTTKPTLNKGEWLFTKVVITWSDNSTTTLYTDERNPNDGVAGQDIIVDGSTDILYYVGDSNSTHPAENSSDWKALNQVTQTQGKWLWSKATTYYRKASSSAGAHDAGSSVNYNVSYIAKDGNTPADARGISSITEYYKATNSNSAMSVPESDSGWDTDPNLSNLTNKWGETYKYLWNYEKVTYNKAPLVERTVPQIVAIWTKDGNAGKGIDSITNYYKVTDTSNVPQRPSTDGTDGWSTAPTAPANGQYLWNYEKITWVNPSSTTYTDVQQIGYAGTNGDTPVKGVDYFDGKDAVSVSLSPENVIVNQSTLSPYTIDLSEAKTVVSVNKGGTPQSSFTISNLNSINCDARIKQGTTNTIEIYAIDTYNTTVDNETKTYYYDNGYVMFDVSFDGKTYSKRFGFYANLLGTWKQTIEQDQETIVARVVNYNFLNGVLTKDNRDYDSFRNAVKTLETWKSEKESTYNGYSTQIVSINSRLSTAEGNINTVRKEVESENLISVLNWENTGEDNVVASETQHSVYCQNEEESVDLYSSLLLLEAGTYTFSACLPDNELSDYSFYYYDGTTTFEAGDGNGELIEFNVTSDSDGIFTRCYGVFDISTKRYVRINVYNEGNTVEFFEPMLYKGNTTSEANLKAYNPNIKIATESNILQTASDISMSIVNKLGATGIYINGDNRYVSVQASKFTVSDNGKQIFGIDSATKRITMQNVLIKGALSYHKVSNLVWKNGFYNIYDAAVITGSETMYFPSADVFIVKHFNESNTNTCYLYAPPARVCVGTSFRVYNVGPGHGKVVVSVGVDNNVMGGMAVDAGVGTVIVNKLFNPITETAMADVNIENYSMIEFTAVEGIVYNMSGYSNSDKNIWWMITDYVLKELSLI